MVGPHQQQQGNAEEEGVEQVLDNGDNDEENISQDGNNNNDGNNEHASNNDNNNGEEVTSADPLAISGDENQEHEATIQESIKELETSTVQCDAEIQNCQLEINLAIAALEALRKVSLYLYLYFGINFILTLQARNLRRIHLLTTRKWYIVLHCSRPCLPAGFRKPNWRN